MARIKVCHMQVLPLMSGVQRAMLEFLDALPSDRYEILVICQQEGPLTEALRERGIRTITLATLIREIRPIPDLRAFVSLCQIFRQEQLDIVHTHSSKPGVVGRLAGRLMGVPVVIHHNHGHAWTWYDPWIKRQGMAFIERLMVLACDQVIFVSEETRQFSVSRGILPERKSITLYNGVDVERLRPATGPDEVKTLRESYGIPSDCFLTCFVARLWEQKNPLAIPSIFAEACRLAPDKNLRLVVAGEGPLEGILKAQLQARGLLDRVHFLGWVPDAAPIYRMSDVLILPSRFEGLPLVLEESLASGLPAVCSRIPGSREVITPEVGFTAPLDNLDALGADIAALAHDPERLTRMRTAARKKAVETFDRKKISSLLPGLYDRLLREKGRGV